MTRPSLPLSGGTYIEHADGRLERIDDQTPTPPRAAAPVADVSIAPRGPQPRPRTPFSGRSARAQPVAGGADTSTTTADLAHTE